MSVGSCHTTPPRLSNDLVVIARICKEVTAPVCSPTRTSGPSERFGRLSSTSSCALAAQVIRSMPYVKFD